MISSTVGSNPRRLALRQSRDGVKPATVAPSVVSTPQGEAGVSSPVCSIYLSVCDASSDVCVGDEARPPSPRHIMIQRNSDAITVSHQ